MYVTGSGDVDNSKSDGMHSSQHQHGVVSQNSPSSSATTKTTDIPSASVSERDCGRWCIVTYREFNSRNKLLSEKFFPGVITGYDGRVRVRALHPIGRNRFIHPDHDDEIWYDLEEFVAFIDEPIRPSTRSRFVTVPEWEKHVKD